MAYYVDHIALTVKKSSCGTDFQTKQAAENALADYIYFSTTYGIDVANIEAVRGGEYADFRSAKNALISEAASDLRKDGQSAEAYERYSRAWRVKNPNESTTFESLGFAPHQPLKVTP